MTNRSLYTDGSPLSEQLLESSAVKILQLESENRRLLKQLALLRDAENNSSTSHIANMNKTTKLRYITNGISSTADTNSVEDVRKQQTRLVFAGDDYSALETRASLLDLENKRLVRKVESFQQMAESVERENGRLIAELERAATEAKQWSEAAAELESEGKRLERSSQQLENSVDLWRRRTTELEAELTALRTENIRLQRHLSELEETTDDSTQGSVGTPETLTCENVNEKPLASKQSDSNRCVTDITIIIQPHLVHSIDAA